MCHWILQRNVENHEAKLYDWSKNSLNQKLNDKNMTERKMQVKFEVMLCGSHRSKNFFLQNFRNLI